jgi:hypothetical protein
MSPEISQLLIVALGILIPAMTAVAIAYLEKVRRDLDVVKKITAATASETVKVVEKTDHVAAVAAQIKVVSDGRLSAATAESTALRAQLDALLLRTDGLTNLISLMQTTPEAALALGATPTLADLPGDPAAQARALKVVLGLVTTAPVVITAPPVVAAAVAAGAASQPSDTPLTPTAVAGGVFTEDAGLAPNTAEEPTS